MSVAARLAFRSEVLTSSKSPNILNEFDGLTERSDLSLMPSHHPISGTTGWTRIIEGRPKLASLP